MALVLNYLAMAAQGPQKTCPGCGAHLAPDLRYCVACYRPIGGGAEARAHIESARAVETTHRADPTVIFLPEEHEAMERRSRRRKRILIASAIALVVLVAGAITLSLLNRHWQETRKAMAREEAALKDLQMLAGALDRFKADVGRYPTKQEGVLGLTRRPAAFMREDAARANNWFGPYLENVPEVDPWGNDYVYETADGGQSFELFSHGPGGETGPGSHLRVMSPAEP